MKHCARNSVSILLGFALAAGMAAATAFAGQGRELRVCADPDNLPFSNDRLEGFENKIAQVIASDLGASLRYTWLSQRGSFIRKTLEAGQCDLVAGVPAGYQAVLATKPYYRSSYVFVSAKSKHFGLHSFDDPVLRKIRIGLHAFGEAGASPAAIALGNRGIVKGITGFTILDTAESPSGKIIDAVAAGDIDVAIVWGPFAGYFAKRQPVALDVVPVESNQSYPPFSWEMTMGVRRGDTAFKQELDGVLDRRSGEIRKILDDFGVPVVNGTPGFETSALALTNNQSKSEEQ